MNLTQEHAETALVLEGAEIPPGITGTYELFSVRGEKKFLLGRVGIVGEVGNRAKDKTRRMTLLLDATGAIPDLVAHERPATIRLLGASHGAKRFKLKAEGAELHVTR